MLFGIGLGFGALEARSPKNVESPDCRVARLQIESPKCMSTLFSKPNFGTYWLYRPQFSYTVSDYTDSDYTDSVPFWFVALFCLERHLVIERSRVRPNRVGFVTVREPLYMWHNAIRPKPTPFNNQTAFQAKQNNKPKRHRIRII